MTYWLFDFSINESNRDVWHKLLGPESEIKLIGTERGNRKIWRWITGSWNALRLSKKNDIIFCWFDFQGVMCWLLSKLTFRRRYIVAVNVMCKFKNSPKGKLYQWLYKMALSSPFFQATVTSKEYGNYLNKMLGVNCDYELVHDLYTDTYICKEKNCINPDPNSVFMGGSSSRDWDFAFRIAEQMPDVTFVFVMGKALYEHYKSRITPNIIVKYDIPVDEFVKLLCSSPIEIMPVDTEAPAGLQTMYYAAANGVLYMTNRTATSCEYITEETGSILPRDVDVWVENIRYYLQHEDEAREKAKRLRCFLETECTGEIYAKGMNRVRDRILEKQKKC